MKRFLFVLALALVVVGGILLAPILILIVLPAMIDMFSTRKGPDHPPAQTEEGVA